jgi:hypothetical protein
VPTNSGPSGASWCGHAAAAVKLRLLLLGCMGLEDHTCTGANFQALYGALCTLEELGARKAEIRLSDDEYKYP